MPGYNQPWGERLEQLRDDEDTARAEESVADADALKRLGYDLNQIDDEAEEVLFGRFTPTSY